jgi:hypothetical protein
MLLGRANATDVLDGVVFENTGSAVSGVSGEIYADKLHDNYPFSGSSLALRNTESSIDSVRTPVKVFCWEGW